MTSMLGFQPVSRNHQRSQISLLSRRRLHNLLGMAAASGAGVLLLIAEPARAQYSIENGGNTITIWGTGRTSNNSEVQTLATPTPSSTPENTWKLIAFGPNNYINDSYDLPTSSPGNNFYIPSSLPSNWAGQSSGVNTPVNLSGVDYRWITYANWQASTANSFGVDPPQGYAQSYFTPSLSGPAVTPLPVTYGLTPPQYYSYIAQTTFTPTISGIYDFSTNIAADNFIEVYLGGSVSGANTLTPDITGGTKLLSLADENKAGLFQDGTLSNARTSSDIPLIANQQYVLNYVIRDNAAGTTLTPTFGSSGFIVGTTAFTYQEPLPVPGPVPALGVAAFLQQARRLRRRIAKRG